MQVFARLPSGETIVLDMEVGASVQDAKDMVFARSGVPATEQLLSCAGQQLEDGSAIDVDENATLQVALRLSGGGDGTPAMGKRHKKTHGLCPRCNKRSYHMQKKRCAACGYPAAKIRSYEWSKKAKRRRAPGTGRMAYKKTLGRRFKNGFREGTVPAARRKSQK